MNRELQNTDFSKWEDYYLYKFKKYQSSVGKAIRDRQLNERGYLKMAEAFKCDRCGKFYSKSGDVSYKVAKFVMNSIIETGWPKYKTLDLCPCCSESLAEWCEAVKEESEN